MNINKTPIWEQLKQHQQSMANLSLHDLFIENPQRAEVFSLQTEHIFLDYSKNRITEKTFELLLKLTETTELKKHIDALFAGENVNFTEQRAALHMDVRTKKSTPNIDTVLHKMQQCTRKIHDKKWLGATGKPITDIVNIGIGGSELGPHLVIDALESYHKNTVNLHFVANIDGSDIFNTLKRLNPETTLLIIVSKSFTTMETLTNANTAKEWLTEQLPKQNLIERHFIAVTAKPERAAVFGITTDNIFVFWDWIGGRYSLWSAVGLSIALAIGFENFKALLAGAEKMDQHFRSATPKQNMPVILALLSVWYINFWHCQTQAIIPYDQHLKLLPAYLQQLVMESNGKTTNLNNNIIDYVTAPVIWGDIGTNSQHAFHQLLHQGSLLIPIDFIVCKENYHPHREQHRQLLINCFAQSRALMIGRTREQAYHELLADGFSDTEAKKLAAHKMILGNKPSNTILLDKLTPKSLGSLIALYEHKTFVEGIIWQINSFDQYGVELGKQLANNLNNIENENDLDASTRLLLKHCHHYKN